MLEAREKHAAEDGYRPKLEPWAHQRRALEVLRGRKGFALLAAMRTGKTCVTLTDFGQLWARRGGRRPSDRGPGRRLSHLGRGDREARRRAPGVSAAGQNLGGFGGDRQGQRVALGSLHEARPAPLPPGQRRGAEHRQARPGPSAGLLPATAGLRGHRRVDHDQIRPLPAGPVPGATDRAALSLPAHPDRLGRAPRPRRRFYAIRVPEAGLSGLRELHGVPGPATPSRPKATAAAANPEPPSNTPRSSAGETRTT
jgi:hypothetical protein